MEGILADFKLTMISPGWMPGGAYEVNKDYQNFFWNVLQARNRIEGTITQDGQTRQVKGVGYADHNWGRKPLNEITHDWLWGRIFADEYHRFRGR
jgi:predicted secreted hydrolase